MKNKAGLLFYSVLTAFIITVLISVLSFEVKSDGIRNSVLRMHVVANSDSEADQELKLKVRDAVLEAGRELFDGSITAEDAEEKLNPEKEKLKKTAQKIIAENGFDYGVDVFIGKTYYTTRTYDNSVTLPAGNYEAVNVIIGEGKGHNWWCVMFPPMCLPAAEADTQIDDVLSDDELKLVKSNPKFEPRFKIVEIYEKIMEKIK
ncbi:MAG: stage II sporulation protein R [Clostridiaceae bacterium]|nr:stage II sporulation protein R [Clostridiaceae bacterium]